MAKKRPEPLTGEIVLHGAPMGRPSIFSQTTADEICERLGTGETLISICRDDHMPHVTTVRKWLANPEKVDFFAAYMRAREAQGHYYFDEIKEIASKPEPAEIVTYKADGTIERRVEDALGHRRLKIDALKWQASKLVPKVYGEATLLKHGDADGEKLPDAPSSVIELARLSVFLLSKAGQIVDKTVDQEG